MISVLNLAKTKKHPECLTLTVNVKHSGCLFCVSITMIAVDNGFLGMTDGQMNFAAALADNNALRRRKGRVECLAQSTTGRRSIDESPSR